MQSFLGFCRGIRLAFAVIALKILTGSLSKYTTMRIFFVKVEKMSSDYTGLIRTISHRIDTRVFYFLKRQCVKIRLAS